MKIKNSLEKYKKRNDAIDMVIPPNLSPPPNNFITPFKHKKQQKNKRKELKK